MNVCRENTYWSSHGMKAHHNCRRTMSVDAKGENGEIQNMMVPHTAVGKIVAMPMLWVSLRL